ncbi:MAG: hypothetical protein EYC68_10835 [Chloroflexota bacterium]|nr:MAG: hypothetical protein EYC68_10835 [Chloroflexota bacterium]
MSKEKGEREHNADAQESVTNDTAGKSGIREGFTRDRVLLAIQIALIAMLSYFLGTSFTSLFHGASASIGALWCAITGIAVLNVTRQATWKEGIRQLRGTLIGVIVGGLYLSFFPFSAVGMGISVGITVLLCGIFGISDTTKFAATSVVMVMVISYSNPDLSPFLNSVLRFCEACIGAGIAMVISFFSPKAQNAA